MSMEKQPQKEDNLHESKRFRRSQAKFNKDVPRYECFCAKQYLSYPALYLHLKNKHHQYFQNSKNGKRVESTKLVEMESNLGYKLYKICQNETTSTEKEKQDMPMQSMPRPVEGQGYADGHLFFPQNNFLPYGNMPYHAFAYDFAASREESTPLPRDAVIEASFGLFIETLVNLSAKQKTQIQLLLATVIQCINENHGITKQQGDEIEYKRYTAEQNCKYLRLFLEFYEQKWLPWAQDQKQDRKEYYSFFVKHSSLVKTGKYKRVLDQLLEFVEGDMDEVQPFRPQPNLTENGVFEESMEDHAAHGTIRDRAIQQENRAQDSTRNK